MQRGNGHCYMESSFFFFFEGIVVSSSAARDYILAAVPSGAAQESHYPAGTLGDIQAVTIIDSEASRSPQPQFKFKSQPGNPMIAAQPESP